MKSIDCMTERACVTCPVKMLKFRDQVKATRLVETVLDSISITPEISIEKLVNATKYVADVQESESVAGAAIGVLAYQLSDFCPQFIDTELDGVVTRVLLLKHVNPI